VLYSWQLDVQRTAQNMLIYNQRLTLRILQFWVADGQLPSIAFHVYHNLYIEQDKDLLIFVWNALEGCVEQYYEAEYYVSQSYDQARMHLKTAEKHIDFARWQVNTFCDQDRAFLIAFANRDRKLARKHWHSRFNIDSDEYMQRATSWYNSK
jgi:hypothetical protein